MGTDTLTGRNITLPICNADGTAFHNLKLNKFTVDSVVMSLGDKITGDVYYKDNHLVVTMTEYVEYMGVKYMLVDPPTVIREGMVSDNGDMKGMTKFSFTFYHPMYMLGNFAFSDVAVTPDQKKYLSESRTFSWIGNCNDFIEKLNKNLEDTQWFVDASGNEESIAKMAVLSDVLSFDKNTIADALKTAYETWKVPYTISSLPTTHAKYDEGKRFLITFGLPSKEILDGEGNPFIFRFGQGVGLKNNSRTPKNNKIITRIAGFGSENNIPFGYPQIVWTGNQDWDFTIDNDSTKPNSYPIYKGIVGGAYVKLIKHPFTRNHLMPSVYVDRVNKKVNPFVVDYDPEIDLIDYYDADSDYPNPIVLNAPSFETHEFDIKPELGEAFLAGVTPWDGKALSSSDTPYISWSQFEQEVGELVASANNEKERVILRDVPEKIKETVETEEKVEEDIAGSYIVRYRYREDNSFIYAKYESDTAAFDYTILKEGTPAPTPVWDDTMDENGDYKQSYFKITLPQLDFDIYALASITEEMQINMRSGACIGCTFPIEVDWDDYKKNFYTSTGEFAPSGEQRDYEKYPDSSQGQITVIVKKEIETFGTLMPNVYQQPKAGDKFVILGISLPTTYITNAERKLDEAMKEYMLENNVYYYDYPLKFDEYFLATHTNILSQMANNTIVRFMYGAEPTMALYIKQITIKYDNKPLPTYDITLTDDVEIVLNQIGQVTDDVSRMRVQVSELQKYYSQNLIDAINEKLSRIVDDVCQGRITFQQGLDSISTAIFHDEVKSPQFKTGLYDGKGWRIDNLGNAEFESIRARSFLEVVELLVNRMQAQEGDTLYTDNDQIDYVQKVVDETDQSVSYILSLKEKFSGYITGQMYGNIIMGVINTLAAKQAGVSGVEDEQAVERDGSNSYFTSWMRVIGTHNTNNTLGVNQIQVVLYGDKQVPAGKNFEPCELMTIARKGCVDYSDPTDPDYEAIKASIIRRQRVFAISVTDGRVTKYTGVDSPILKEGNYGVTIGELPDFVKEYTEVKKVLDRVGEHSDWLYAQGVVVGNYIKINKTGLPVPVTVFCDEWVDGSTIQDPTVGHGIYFYNEFNDDTLQYEIHEVRHNGGRWQCLQHQPVIRGGVATYYEPKWNSPYWRLVDGNDNLTIEFVSSRGYAFRRNSVDTVITPHLFYGNVDITDDVAAEYWTWERESNSGKTEADRSWDAQHKGLTTGVKTLHLTNNDMPATWSSADRAIFTCTAAVNDGKTTRIVDNQIIS